MKFIESSSQLSIIKDSLENYIENPKESGYCSIHILANLAYDSVKNDGGKIEIVDDKMICEIQIRTKLQDAWGDITHEFHYKAKASGIENHTYEKFLSDVANRLRIEDDVLKRFREVYQELADEKAKNGKRKGLETAYIIIGLYPRLPLSEQQVADLKNLIPHHFFQGMD